MRRSAEQRDTRRDLAVTVAFAVAQLGLVLAAIHARVEPDARPPDALAYTLAAGIGALLLLRRHRPLLMLAGSVALLITYHALSYPAVGAAVPLAGALYFAAEAGLLRAAVVGAIAPLAVSIPYRLIFEHEHAAYVLGFDLPVNAGLLAAVIALGDALRSRRGWRAELDRRLADAQAQREEQTARRIEQHRMRIARELHDVLAHTITVISLHSDVAREALRDDPDLAEESLRAVRAASGDAGRELRSTVDLLRAPEQEADPLAPVGGVDALGPVVRAVTDAGLRVDLRTYGDPVPLSTAVDTTAHRIVQESLTNVLRHAGARQATVELRYGRRALTVRVADDGHGAARTGDPDDPGGTEGPDGNGGTEGQHGGWGITGMRERAHLLGGELHTTSSADGFVVHAELPLVARA